MKAISNDKLFKVYRPEDGAEIAQISKGELGNIRRQWIYILGLREGVEKLENQIKDLRSEIKLLRKNLRVDSFWI